MYIAADYSLLNHNTFGIDVKTDTFVEYDSEEELIALLPKLKNRTILHIGQGSNLLFTQDFKGVILHSAVTGIDAPLDEDSTHVLLRVGGGVVFDRLIVHTLERGLYGLENLSYIPGEVGASAVQNVGAYGVEAKDVIASVEAVDLRTGKKYVFSADECRYAYRQSIFKQEWKGRFAITAVTFRLSRTFHPCLEYGGLKGCFDRQKDAITAQQVRDVIIGMRRSKLPEPSEWGSAGSFFINPVVSESLYEKLRSQYPDMPHYAVADGKQKIPAGWLIEQCGWKGRSLGRAGVYSKQALVLINLGGATGREVLQLSEEVCRSVYDKFGISIHPEVNVF